MQSALEAISNPSRRKMLELVMEQERQVSELAELTGMTQPATSQHLKVLRDSGLVDVRVDGPRRLYSVNFQGVSELRSALDAFWGGHLEKLRQVNEDGG